MNIKERRYDLDWWRVISIFAVYLHHIGMPFNGDDFHIMNNESSKLLDDIMVFFEQFRLPILFLISGVGTVYAFQRRNWIHFIKERSYRLLIPLIFGVLIIVPPQTFFENYESFNSYLDVYSKEHFKLKANHLWFLENLFFLSILCIPIILFFKSTRFKTMLGWVEKTTSTKLGMFLWVIPLVLIRIISKKYFPSDSKDITNLSSTLFYGYFFIAGILINQSDLIWSNLKNYRRHNLKLSMFSIIVFYGYYFFPEGWVPENVSNKLLWDIWYTVSVLLSWSLIITALGYGQVFFNRKSNLLPLLNQAAYPFYILHQTVIVVLAYYIVQLNLSILFKIALLLISTLSVTIVIYRFVIYPFKIARFLFGVKSKSSAI
ncbi:acyltransferase family protein [Spongiivirga citrea]|uniref:Acyltransferase family protein n=1 Tax=Spongiivirga citrea TaxID=1481457 RepID=A0A6M0CJP5_9FLAO|nr:acyltransferase family protein [Spongiivirga citrea]NER16174.1 acyltransferase family protein [Spongiivirga citrea]